MPKKFTCFVNCRLCRNGKLVDDHLVVSNETGCFLDSNGYVSTDSIDLHGAIVAPGFIELQTNGTKGFHFTHFDDEEKYARKLDEVAAHLPSTGVTAFYATIPTVAGDDFKKILPSLSPREIPASASLLGAHAEGPYLHPSKKGAHNSSLFQPPTKSPVDVYGDTAETSDILKLVTVAPELEGSSGLISQLVNANIRVSLGHSAATYNQGLAAMASGATCLTHTLNAMAPMHHRDPGLTGLITSSAAGNPYFSIIADGNHLHPSVVSMLFKASPERCILITDSIELAGLEDGTYPGHAQIPQKQTKIGSRVVIEGTNTLIGGCAALSGCVHNLLRWSNCTIPQAVQCVTENIANFMGDESRGKLESGRRADFVILDDNANVLQVFIAGRKVYEKRKRPRDE